MNWGMLGYGKIAPKFTASLAVVPGQTFNALASRSNAKSLAEKLPDVKVFDTYEALCADPEVDIIYVSTTHNYHKEHVLLALEHGKHVLCEKPMTLSYADTKMLIDTARSKGLLLMEGVWSRFQPNYRKLKALLAEDVIGKVRLVRADFGFKAPWLPERRIFNPDLAGGGTYDVGVYPIMFANDIFGGIPDEIHAYGQMTTTGVDGACSMLFRYPGGGMAQLNSGVDLRMRNDAIIYGENGWIEIPLFWQGQEMKVFRDGELIGQYDNPFISTGYSYEIASFVKSLEEDAIENPIFSHQDSLDLAWVVDQVLAQISYPSKS